MLLNAVETVVSGTLWEPLCSLENELLWSWLLHLLSPLPSLVGTKHEWRRLGKRQAEQSKYLQGSSFSPNYRARQSSAIVETPGISSLTLLPGM